MLNKSTLANKTLLHLAVIIFLGLIAYSNTFDVPFQFDDEIIVLKSSRFKDITAVPSMFVNLTGPWASRPLLHATMAVNYYFGGLDTTGYHALNLATHLVNGLLLYFVILMTGRQIGRNDEELRPVALLSSTIFVLHPLHTDAVTYIVSRSMLLATCFYLAGILLFLKAASSAQRRWPYAAGLFLVSFLGMASRENFATFPLMLFLYDMFFISRFRLREAAAHYRIYLPVILSFGYFVFLALNNTYTGSSEYIGAGLTPAEYVLTAINVHLTYLRLLVLPAGQNIDYDYRVASGLLEYPTLMSFISYLGLWVFGIVFARRRPVAAFATLWFLIALIPVSFGVALVDGLRIDDVIFEHRLYLPSAGVIMAMAAVVILARDIDGKKVRAAAIASIAMFPLVLGTATYTRNTLWQSKISIWEDVVSKSPGKWRAHYNLANEYRETGMLEKAVEQFQEAIKLNPDYPPSYNNLGISFKGLGLNDKALEHYLLAIKKDPTYVEAYNNIGNIYLVKELYDKAADYYGIALKLKPDSAEIHYNMGNALFYRGRYEKAIEHYKASLDLNPDEAEAHNNLGVAYLRLGQKKLAQREVEEAIRLDPGLTEARESLEEILEAFEYSTGRGKIEP